MTEPRKTCDNGHNRRKCPNAPEYEVSPDFPLPRQLLETDCTFDSETGAVTGFTPLWVRVRFEMGLDSEGHVYLPTGGASMFAEVKPEARFRWPKDRRGV